MAAEPFTLKLYDTRRTCGGMIDCVVTSIAGASQAYVLIGGILHLRGEDVVVLEG